MNLLNRFRTAQTGGGTAVPVQTPSGRGTSPLHAPVAVPGSGAAPRSGRFSNGLKEFLWQLEGVGHGKLLDLGQASQATFGFFIERGFKVYSDDLLMGWRNFLGQEDEEAKQAAEKQEFRERSAGAVAERFLASNLNQAPDSFDAVLLWDLLDYLEREAAAAVLARLTNLVRDGGVVLSVFHTKTPESFCRYRVLDVHNLELVNLPQLVPAQRVYQNREIQDFFRRFRSSKSFVGRDQLREIVFVK